MIATCSIKTLQHMLGKGTVLLGAVVLSVAFIPHRSYAQMGCVGETCFGGLNSFVLECTCDNDKRMAFVMDYKSNQLLKLIHTSSSRLFNYNLIYGRYLLGSYRRSSDVCKVGKKPYCATITADGVLGMSPGTGTSM